MSVDSFLSDEYQRHNRRRQEHLATLGLDIAGCSVLEVGAGIGDHTSFFLDRGCRVTVTDARFENLVWVQKRHANVAVCVFDANTEAPVELAKHDIVYAYGVLYHLDNPAEGIKQMSNLCSDMLLLETCVSYGDESLMHPVSENEQDATQAVHGRGCRPTRKWIFDELSKHFQNVYLTLTQPWHEEFPIDWTATPTTGSLLSRSVFIASRHPINRAVLSSDLVNLQRRH